jgi:benzodiazapine receptor
MEAGNHQTGSQAIAILTLVGSIILCTLAGFIGSLVTVTEPGSWYELLIKPSFNPPSWLFFPVWTTLYVLMGISLFLVLIERKKGLDVRTPLAFFGIQLVLNVLWSYLFFGLESPAAGLIGIIILWIFILATIISFFRVNHIAAYLLLPYILWVTFASVLNFAIYQLNP